MNSSYRVGAACCQDTDAQESNQVRVRRRNVLSKIGADTALSNRRRVEGSSLGSEIEANGYDMWVCDLTRNEMSARIQRRGSAERV